MKGCHGHGKVRENKILVKVTEKSGSFVSGQGISKFLYKVREFFILRLLLIILLGILYRKDNFVKDISEPSLFLLFHGQKNIIIAVSEKSGIVFVPVGGNLELPDYLC